MYILYDKIVEDSAHYFQFKNEIHLFGCNSGYIPKLLRSHLREQDTEPYPWHVNIKKSMANIGQTGGSLIINLKPNSTSPNLSLYEIVDVWGYSSGGWTPIMFHLRGLFCDADPAIVNEHDFHLVPSECEDPIFSMTYLSGTVRNGRIEGKWTPPRPSATNSVLLWPSAFKYFTEEAQKMTK